MLSSVLQSDSEETDLVDCATYVDLSPMVMRETHQRERLDQPIMPKAVADLLNVVLEVRSRCPSPALKQVGCQNNLAFAQHGRWRRDLNTVRWLANSLQNRFNRDGEHRRPRAQDFRNVCLGSSEIVNVTCLGSDSAFCIGSTKDEKCSHDTHKSCRHIKMSTSRIKSGRPLRVCFQTRRYHQKKTRGLCVCVS